jgi:putative peptidoglycan lipid II flippase
MFYLDGVTAVVVTGLAGYLMVPVMARVVRERGEAEGFRLMETCLLWLSVLVAPAIAFCMFHADSIAVWVAPGFPPDRQQSVADLTRFALPTMYFILIGGVMAGLLQASRDYYSPVHGRTLFALATALALVFAPVSGVRAAGVGFLAGALLQIGAHMYGLRRLGWRPQWPARWHPGLTHALEAGLPSLLALILVNVVMGGAQRIVASGLPEGAFSAINYAQRTFSLAASVNLSIATVALTELSLSYSRGGLGQATRALLENALLSGIWMLVPLTALLVLVSDPLVGLLFHRGQYDLQSLHLTALCLRWMALALVPGMILAVLHRAAPAFDRPWRSVSVSLVWTAATVVSTMALLPTMGAASLAAGHAAGMAIGTIAGVLVLVDIVPLGFYRPIIAYALRMTAYSAAGVLAALAALGAIGPATSYSLIESLVRLAVIASAFLGTTLTAALVGRDRRTRDAVGALRRWLPSANERRSG